MSYLDLPKTHSFYSARLGRLESILTLDFNPGLLLQFKSTLSVDFLNIYQTFDVQLRTLACQTPTAQPSIKDKISIGRKLYNNMCPRLDNGLLPAQK